MKVADLGRVRVLCVSDRPDDLWPGHGFWQVTARLHVPAALLIEKQVYFLPLDVAQRTQGKDIVCLSPLGLHGQLRPQPSHGIWPLCPGAHAGPAERGPRLQLPLQGDA